jgi:hypothetical protein
MREYASTITAGRRLLAAAVCAIGCTSAPPRLDPMRSVPVALCPRMDEPRLQFESAFWLNLHNFLVKEAKRHEGIDDDGQGARGNIQADTAGLRALTPAERRAWDSALKYYATNVLTDRMAGADSIVARVNDRLAASPEESLEAPDLDPALAAALTEVAPIYRAVWWPIHDAHNQTWIKASRGLVDRYGGCVFAQLQRDLRRPWPSTPITIYATTYASWFGAYTTTVAGPRVTISTNAIGNQETYALENILHESAHAGLLLEPSDSLMAVDAAKRGISLERELSHVVLFYTTGEIVSGLIPAHVPYAVRFGIWSRNSETKRLEGILIDNWKPYLAGSTSFETAVDAVVQRSRR